MFIFKVFSKSSNVTERKRAEAETRLYLAKLERSNRDLQDFAFVASHDLQEPLRKIMTFRDRLKLACADSLNDEARDYLERIFTPFQRLHGRKTYEGTGIGLTICKRIVERHGGYVTARSSPGSGATFIVTLPARQKATASP